MNNEQMKSIIGGIFGTGTYTVWDEEGQAQVKKEKFNIRLYKDLWHSGAIQKLKGNRLGVFLTIAIHADHQGEGWPTQNTIANMLGIGRDAVINALKQLEKDGFIEREKTRHKGKYDNTVYKIKFAPDLSKDEPKENKRKKTDRPQINHVGKTDMVEIPENQGSHHVGKTDTEKPTRKNRHGKADTKKNLSFKNDPDFKNDPFIKEQQQEPENKKEVVVVSADHSILICEKWEELFNESLSVKKISTLSNLAIKGMQMKQINIHNPSEKDVVDRILYVMQQMKVHSYPFQTNAIKAISDALENGYTWNKKQTQQQKPRVKVSHEKIPSALVDQLEQGRKEVAATKEEKKEKQEEAWDYVNQQLAQWQKQGNGNHS